MKLIVGLGNPGKEYENTRHNIGFMFIDYYAKKRSITIDKKKFNGLYATDTINGEKVVFVKPQSYMNLSGEVVGQYAKYYNIEPEDVLIIHDDLDLPVGKYRLRYDGGTAGHNGLKNIELHLGTDKYKRLKIGISNDKELDTKDYVLGKFSKEDKEQIESLYEIVSDILDDYLKIDFEELMSKYNRK